MQFVVLNAEGVPLDGLWFLIMCMDCTSRYSHCQNAYMAAGETMVVLVLVLEHSTRHHANYSSYGVHPTPFLCKECLHQVHILLFTTAVTPLSHVLPVSYLSVSRLCSKVWSTTISVYSQVCSEISLHNCRKCRSVQSILQ